MKSYRGMKGLQNNFLNEVDMHTAEPPLSRKLLKAGIILCFFSAALLLAQVNDQPVPTKAEMNRWDQGVISFYEILIMATALIAFIACIIVPILGKRFWWATRPNVRILIVSALVIILLEILIWNMPFLIESDLIQGASPRYIQFIQDVAFQGSGLFGGMFNPGVPAVAWSQLVTVAILVFFAVTVGAIAAYIVLRIIRRIRGLPSEMN